MIVLVYSAGCKAYREDWCNNFESDPFVGKFMEFQEKFQKVTTKGGKVKIPNYEQEDNDDLQSALKNKKYD